MQIFFGSVVKCALVMQDGGQLSSKIKKKTLRGNIAQGVRKRTAGKDSVEDIKPTLACHSRISARCRATPHMYDLLRNSYTRDEDGCTEIGIAEGQSLARMFFKARIAKTTL
jgi:hypothetical protein